MDSFINRLTSRSFLSPFLGVGVVSILMRLSGYAVISHFTATFLSNSGLPNSHGINFYVTDVLLTALCGVPLIIFRVVIFWFLPDQQLTGKTVDEILFTGTKW